MRQNVARAPTIRLAQLRNDSRRAALCLRKHVRIVARATRNFNADVRAIALTIAVSRMPTIAIKRQTLNRLILINCQVIRNLVIVRIHVVDFVRRRRTVRRVVHTNAYRRHLVRAFRRPFRTRANVL